MRVSRGPSVLYEQNWLEENTEVLVEENTEVLVEKKTVNLKPGSHGTSVEIHFLDYFMLKYVERFCDWEVYARNKDKYGRRVTTHSITFVISIKDIVSFLSGNDAYPFLHFSTTALTSSDKCFSTVCIRPVSKNTAD